MMIYTREGKRFNIYSSATINGVTYPNFTDKSVRDTVGIVEVATPDAPTDFSHDTYTVNEIDDAPYVVYERKSDDVIALETKRRINAESLRYLNETDWYVVRFVEAGTPIPEDVKLARQAARDAIVSV